MWGEWVTSCGVSCVCKLDAVGKTSGEWSREVDTYPFVFTSMLGAFGLYVQWFDDPPARRRQRHDPASNYCENVSVASSLTNVSLSIGRGRRSQRRPSRMPFIAV